jgi:IMP dehydrogenase
MTPRQFDEVRVEAFMTDDAETARPHERVADVVDRLRARSRGGGLPVLDREGRVVGFVGARDLLGVRGDAPVEAVMNRDVVAVRPEATVEAVAEVMLRTGHRNLPVVDDDGSFLGVVSNADVVRSRIERTTPSKVESTRKMLESAHGVPVGVDEGDVAVSELIPTQREVYADELEGRAYELERDLAEPLMALTYGEETLLVDGHHRALAARELGIERMRAHLLAVDPAAVPKLGLRNAARTGGLRSLADVEVNDDASPHADSTERGA